MALVCNGLAQVEGATRQQHLRVLLLLPVGWCSAELWLDWTPPGLVAPGGSMINPACVAREGSPQEYMGRSCICVEWFKIVHNVRYRMVFLRKDPYFAAKKSESVPLQWKLKWQEEKRFVQTIVGQPITAPMFKNSLQRGRSFLDLSTLCRQTIVTSCVQDKRFFRER